MIRSINLVVAMTKNRGIGLKGQLPWNPKLLREDINFFKKITMNTNDPTKINSVIMGRKTWNSLSDKFKPLPNRFNIILSRSNFEHDVLIWNP